MANLAIDSGKAVDTSLSLVRGPSATRWKMLVSAGDFYLQNNFNSTNGYTNVISAIEASDYQNTKITIHGRLFINNGIILSNNSWLSYGTYDPQGNVTGEEGRLYFKIIS